MAQSAHVGRFGSHRFITYRTVLELTTAEFLRSHFLCDEGMLRIGEASPGRADRSRVLGLEQPMAIEVPAPPQAVQRAFDRLPAHVASQEARHSGRRSTTGGCASWAPAARAPA